MNDMNDEQRRLAEDNMRLRAQVKKLSQQVDEFKGIKERNKRLEAELAKFHEAKE